MSDYDAGADPTRTDPAIPEVAFSIDAPRGGGALAGYEWNAAAGGRGRVAILHGLGDHAARYGRPVRALVDRGFAVEALDLPGHGRSYGARGHVASWNDYREAVEAWWRRPRVWGGAPVALVGHSMGALVALDWTLRHPEAVHALVLSAPPFDVVVRATMLKVRAAQLIVRVWPGFSQKTTILPTMLSHDQAVVRAHNLDPLVHYTMSAKLFFEFTAMNAALRKSAGRLTVPTLVLHGSDDVVAGRSGSQKWAATAPDGMADFRLYPGLFHEIFNEPEGPHIAAEMAAWLTKHVDR